MLQGQTLFGSRPVVVDDGICALGRSIIRQLPEDAFDLGPLSRAHFRFVADVRLDNRDEIIASLGRVDSDSRQLSDSALLFHSLLKWGESAINRWVGEFSFAFWDGAKRELLLGRDILGLRPLHFHRGGNFFAFSSMPSGLHALEEVDYDFDADFLAERLALLPHFDERTCFRKVERVVPGYVVRVTAGGMRSERYWQPPRSSTPLKSSAEFEEGLRSVFDQAVSAQLRGARGVVASHLSGGLDSSAVTATVARLASQMTVHAYTAVPRAGFRGKTPPNTIANEAELAAATACLYDNIEHIVIENSGESPLAGLDRSFLYEQQPTANLCNSVWGRSINRAARDSGAKILFKGGLGNLTVSYSGLSLLPHLLSRGRLASLARHNLQLARNGMPLLALGAQSLGPFVPPSLWRALRIIGGRSAGPGSFSAPSLAKSADTNRKAIERGFDMAGRPGRDPYADRLRTFAQADGGNSYKAVLAEYGLGIRDPTGDKRVIEFCLSVPTEEYLRDGTPRSLARRAFSDRLPAAVTGSKVRGYQAADWYEGLERARPDIEREVRAIERCEAAGEALNIQWLTEALDGWPKNWDGFEVRDRYRLGLMRGISAGHFMRKVRGTN